MSNEDQELNSITFTPNDTYNTCITGASFFEASDGEMLKESVKRLENKVYEVKNPVTYILVNKGLGMGPEKISAQVAHAQEELFVEILNSNDNDLRDFQFKCMKQNPRTVIVLEVSDTEQLYKAVNYFESCGLICGIYVDEGSANGDYLLEPTAVAVQYLDKTDPRTETIFKIFKLYKEEDETRKHHSRVRNWFANV